MKEKKSFIYLIFTLLLLLPLSCGEETFAPKQVKQGDTANNPTVSDFDACSSFTLIKPKVDFLFLWDNSTSSVFINDDTKNALNQTIQKISSSFDYHVMLAPLVVKSTDPVNHQAKLIVENTNGLTSDSLSMLIDPAMAAQSLNFSYSQGSQEKGLDRAIDIIKANIDNKVFRANSYLYVVLMSNQDDSSWHKNPVAEADRTEYLERTQKEFLCLRGSYSPANGSCTGANLNSIQARFMSITAFNERSSGYCGGISSWDKGATYQMFSKAIYREPYQTGGAPQYRQSDQANRPGVEDTYDICSQSSFAGIFDGINSSITDTLITHRYNYWPVASSSAPNIDPEEITVKKNGTEIPRLTPPVSAGESGFTFTNTVQTVNTRFAPTAGEPFTGYVVELHGNAIVQTPECITVQTQTPKEFFGYIQLRTKPVEDSIVLRINGVTIPKSATNGWQLVKSGGQPQYIDSKNIKIINGASFCPSSSTDYCPATPALNKSGYFLQVFGDAVYSNGAVIDVSFDPST